jgi:hypothetical protein
MRRRRGVPNTTEASAFLQEIERLMAEKGIEDLEELHERFLDREPERIGNARWTYSRFRKHATNGAGGLYHKFMRPLVRALEATGREQERLFFAWVGWDPPSDA